MENYITVRHSAEFEYEDRKSRFIAECIPVECEADALAFIERMRKSYPDANHHVYAYVIKENSIARFTDDREPSGTAGMPVLDIIRKNGCTNVAIVVVRYFGGTLLGTGGLVRAYSGAALGALKAAEIITYDIYSGYEIECSYSDYQKIGTLLSSSGFRTENTEYSDVITVTGSIRHDLGGDFEKKLVEITSGRIIIKKTGEKFDF
ncbi:MAG: YigZ family protein [Clostridia bacterium]|nr:YigZ family protein [Clostridia bacterium]